MRSENRTHERDPRRWGMIALVFLATLINYLDRQTLSVVAPVLVGELQISSAAYGRVLFAFMLAYTIMNGVSGPLIDRVGTRVGYALCMFVWSLATMLHARARSAWDLGLYRFLLGMGEAGNWPAGVRVVAEWFSPQQRGLASGIFNSGSSVGAIVAPPLIAAITLRFDWRAAFLITGAIGLLWLVPWWLFYRSPLEGTPNPTSSSKSLSYGIKKVFTSPFLLWFTTAKVFLDPVWYFYIFWFPQYLHRERNFDLADIGTYAWIPFAAAGIGNLLGGGLAAVGIRKSGNVLRVRSGVIVFSCFLMLSAIPAVQSATAGAAIVWVSLAAMGYTAASANLLALPADVFPREVVASVYGLASVGSGLGGMVFSLLTGWAVDRYSFGPVFFVYGLMPTASALILARALRGLQASEAI